MAQLDPAVAAVPLGGDYWQGTSVARGEVWGLADLHAHYFNSLGFGGRVLHGAPWAPNGMRQALASCRGNHGDDGRGFSTAILPEPAHRTSGFPRFEGWPRWDTSIHQQAYVDWIRRAWEGGLRLVQVDVQNTGFLGSAYDTANGLFVKGQRTVVPLDDVTALQFQTAAARTFFNEGPAKDFAAIARTPAEARSIIASGKLAVVLGIEVEALGNFSSSTPLGEDPQVAVNALVDELWASGVRHVIPVHLTRNAFGHPAVFNPTLNVMNYADTGSFYATEEAFDAGVRFDPTRAPGQGLASLLELTGRLKGQAPFPSGARSVAASEGLTPAGKVLVETLIRRGFILDVEHMSQRGVDEALVIAAKLKRPVMSSHAEMRDVAFGTRVTYLDGGFDAVPLPGSMRETPEAYGTSDALKVRSEKSRTRAQLEAIRSLGGMVGVPLVSHGVGVSWRDRIPLDCDSSSKGFLQQLSYAEEVMGPAVAIATDVGGFAMMPAPRFGVEACPGARGDELRSKDLPVRTQALAQRNGVRYQSEVSSVGAWRFERWAGGAFSAAESRAWLSVASDAAAKRPAGVFDGGVQDVVVERWRAMTEGPNPPLTRSVAGFREFDVNVDGMAHYGLLPDFLQDASNVARAAGAGDVVPPLFRSAEVYLQMWERL